jgi:hypothetical protein
LDEGVDYGGGGLVGKSFLRLTQKLMLLLLTNRPRVPRLLIIQYHLWKYSLLIHYYILF